MPTTGSINGTLYKITVGGTEIDSLTSNSATFTAETRDTTTKSSGGWKESQTTLKSGSYSAEIIVSLDDAYAMEELYDAWVAGTPVSVVFTTGVTGDVQWSQNANITECSIEAPLEDNVTGSFSFEGTGPINKSNA